MRTFLRTLHFCIRIHFICKRIFFFLCFYIFDANTCKNRKFKEIKVEAIQVKKEVMDLEAIAGKNREVR